MIESISQYYSSHSRSTDPGRQRDLLSGLPAGVEALVKTVQGCMIHVFWADRYGVHLTEERQQTLQIRSVAGKLEAYRNFCSLPLAEARPITERLVGNCRDFSQLLVSFLRIQGIPARARCGFGTYFLPDHFEDHWVAEYWHEQQKRWIMVDAQLDPFQQQALQIDFNPLDVPHDRFIVAGKAWQMCRTGEQDPSKFGIFDMRGLGFVRANLVRDALALNKVEILPWDGGWGYMTKNDDEMTPADWEYNLFDRLAVLTQAGNECWQELHDLIEGDPRMQVPEDYGV